MEMGVNKPFTLILTLLILVLIMIADATAATNYMGFYEVINWPIISISIINGTSTSHGVIIIISPNKPVNQQYYIFAGIGVLGNGYFLIDGMLYPNGTISIYSLTLLNTTISKGNVTTAVTYNNTEYGGFENIIVGGHTYREGRVPIMPLRTSSSQATANTTATGMGGSVNSLTVKSKVVANNVSLRYLVVMVSLITSFSLITLSIILPLIGTGRSEGRVCINDSFIRLIRKLGLSNPSLTHRDVGDYLINHLHVNEGLVNKLINYYEIAIYGGVHIECEEFKALIKQVIDEGIRRRHR